MGEYRTARVTLSVPASLPMYVHTANGVAGSNKPQVKNGIAHWEWRVRNTEPLPSQNWSTSAWEFSPTIMASTYPDYSALGRAYHLKAGEAAKVTPKVQAQARADEITRGIDDRRAQAAALYEWVAKNIRYVAVYLGNGGLEPNTADSILANHYGVALVGSSDVTLECAVRDPDGPVIIARKRKAQRVGITESLQTGHRVHRRPDYRHSQRRKLRKQPVELNRFGDSAPGHGPGEKVQHHRPGPEQSREIDLTAGPRRHEKRSFVAFCQHRRASFTGQGPSAS